MIRRLSGVAAHVSHHDLIVDVGGVGYAVRTPLAVAASLHEGDECSLFIHLVMREPSIDLYGFFSQSDLSFFELLIGISGIGPRSALAIMNLAPAERLIAAIASGDIGYLTKISGIGKKSAEKIILELKDKLALLAPSVEKEAITEHADALEALKTLGYDTRAARDALHALDDTPRDLNRTIKDALKLLGR